MLRHLQSTLATLSVLSSTGLMGCATTCDTREDSSEVLRFTGGDVDPSRTFYQTSAFDERFLDFPPGRRYELIHGLIGIPNHIETWVSFEPRALATGNNISPGAGNQTVIERADETVV